jgi:opacity protein-like surface antigen
MQGEILRHLIWGALASALVLAAPAGAGERSWYMGLEAGLELEGGGNSYGYDPADGGFAGLLTLGTGITSHLNLEGELGYRSTSDDGIDIDQTTLLLNLVYEAPLSQDISIDLGVGVGADRVVVDYFGFFEESEIEAVAQFKIGLSLDISDSTELTANYRYVETLTDSAIDDSTVTVGMRFAL